LLERFSKNIAPVEPSLLGSSAAPERAPARASRLKPFLQKAVALDRHGEAFELSVDGLLAVCVQHEMDHLEGKLFVDYLSPLKREMVRKKLAKQRKLAADAA
jgi:hypothetical protein